MQKPAYFILWSQIFNPQIIFSWEGLSLWQSGFCNQEARLYKRQNLIIPTSLLNSLNSKSSKPTQNMWRKQYFDCYQSKESQAPWGKENRIIKLPIIGFFFLFLYYFPADKFAHISNQPWLDNLPAVICNIGTVLTGWEL